MTSRRSWLLGLALGAALTVGSIQDTHAQSVPRTITYQGQLLENGVPATGSYQIRVALYTSGGGGSAVYDDTFLNVPVQNGIFNIVIGSGTQVLDAPFDEQYFLGVTINGGTELPRTPLHSSPYAINSDQIDGFHASQTAAPDRVVVSNASGKIDPAWLPATPNFLLTVNGVPGNPSGNFDITAGTGVTITPGTNGITISANTTGGGVQTITAGPGLIGGGGPDQNGNVFIGLGPNAIDGTMIGNGVITGRKLSFDVAGEGLYQDILGNLNVGVDNSSIEISGDQLRIKAGGVGTSQLADGAVTTAKIADGAVTAAKVNPAQVQLRVTGVADPGTFIRAINQDGSVSTATVLVNSTLTRAVTGNDLTLGINLANPNTWTGAQNFNGGATASTLTVTGATTTNGITNTGNIATSTLNSTGNVTVGGNLAVTGTTALTGAATTNGITNTGNVTTTTFNSTGNSSVGGNFAVTGTTTLTGAATTNGITNTGNVGTTTLSTTGNATIGDDLTVTNQITAAAAGHTFGTNGTNATVLTINGVTDGGAVDELVVNGDAAFTGVVDFNDITADIITANTVNTSNLGGNGGNITLTSNVNAGAQTINNGVFAGYTLNSGNIAVGHTLTNNGTITGGAITNALISGGTINGTIIGNTTPAEGTFTDITVNDLADIERLQVNTTSHFDGLATFGTSPALNGNKVVIDGIVSPTPIASSADYELVVNGDAQVTGTMFANNFQSLVLQAPTILFDVAMPFSGTTMTFQGGTMIHNGLGTFDNGMTFNNTPAGFYSIAVNSNPGANGIKLTGAPGSPVGLDVDPYNLGIRVDAVNTGIQIMNAPVSLEADGIIDAMGTIENSVGNVTINDDLDQTGGGQVTFSGNVDANSGLDVTGASTFTGGIDQFGGAPVNFSGMISGTSAGNSLGDGADATQLTVNGVVGGATEFIVNGDAAVTGMVTVGGLSLLGDIDMNGNDIVDVGNLEFSQATSEISNTGGDVTIDDNVIVTGNADIDGNADVDGTFNADGASTFGSTVTVTGATALNSTLTVTGATTLNGSATIGNGDADAVAINTTGNFTVASDDFTIDASGNTDVDGTFNADGAATFGSTVTVTGATTLNSTLTVAGTTNLNGASNIGNGDADAVVVNTTGNFTVASDDFTIDASGNTDIDGTLTVDGAGLMNSSLTVVGTTNLNGASNIGNGDADAVVVNTTGNFTVASDDFTIDAAGNTDIDGTLTVDGVFDANAAGNMMGDGANATQLTVDGVVTGPAAVGADFEVNVDGDLLVGGHTEVGSLELNGDLDMNQWDIIDAGNIAFTEATSNLSNSAGDVTVNDNLVVTGTSDLQGSVMNSTANNSGRVHVADDAETTGNTLLATASGSDLTVGNADGLGTHLINGSSIFDGTGAAADVIFVQDVPAGSEGLHVAAGDNANAAIMAVHNSTTNSTAIVAEATGASATNVGLDVTANGGTTSNFGITVDVNGVAPTGITIDANDAGGSNGMTITGAVNGVGVTLPNATNGNAFAANLDAGDNQTGFRVDMNGGGGSSAGVSISEIGAGTGAVIDMTGAAGATGLNVTDVGTNTGISVGDVSGGGIGISAVYSDNGAGGAILAQSTSSNTTSEAIRAVGVAGGAAAIDVTSGGIDATAAVGGRFADTQAGGAAGTGVDVVINNSVVRAGSTIILTYKNTSGGAFVAGALTVVSQANGTFSVRKSALWDAGDQIEYMIINHGL